MSFRLLTAPTATPVSLAEAKRHLNVTHLDHDILIQTYLDAAVQQLDGPKGMLGQALMAQAWAWSLDDGFPAGSEIVIPMAPLISVEAVKYVDDDGATQTVAEADWDVILERGLVAPVFDGSWPTARSQRGAVTVEFTAGYADAARVPSPIKAAILLKTGQLYANREPAPADERAIENLLSPYRRWWG